MKPVVIVGAGDYAEVAYQYLKRDNYEVLGFSVESDFRQKDSFLGLPLSDFENIVSEYPVDEVELLVAIGPSKVNSVRQRLFLESKEKGYELLTYISPKSNVWDPSKIGENSFVFDGCVVESEARIGHNTILWSNVVVAHHSTVGNHCFLAPSVAVSGRIQIKDNCFLGINATIRDQVVVAENCIIGCGAVIKKDTLANGVYSANPTKLLHTESIETKV